jgi:hypothetical protein
MKPGDLVRHTGKPEWGVGVVVECAGTNSIIHFEQKGRIMLQVAAASPRLVEVARADVGGDSALLDPQRWASLALPPEQRVRARAGATTTASCIHCKQPLNRSQYSEGKRMKSCPKCSSSDGAEHIFYEYPVAFGQSEARVSEGTPDGAQSYCSTCRTNDDPVHAARRCSTITAR